MIRTMNFIFGYVFMILTVSKSYGIMNCNLTSQHWQGDSIDLVTPETASRWPGISVVYDRD